MVTRSESGGDFVTFCVPPGSRQPPDQKPAVQTQPSPEAAPEDTQATRAGQDNAARLRPARHPLEPGAPRVIRLRARPSRQRPT
jgi:hypothetical protein